MLCDDYFEWVIYEAPIYNRYSEPRIVFRELDAVLQCCVLIGVRFSLHWPPR